MFSLNLLEVLDDPCDQVSQDSQASHLDQVFLVFLDHLVLLVSQGICGMMTLPFAQERLAIQFHQ